MSDHCSIQQQSFHLAMDVYCSSDVISIDQELATSFVFKRRLQRSCRRQQPNLMSSSRFILLALCFIAAASSCYRSHAFSTSPVSSARTIISAFSSSSPTPPTTRYNKEHQPSKLYMSTVADIPAQATNSSRMTDFQRRMKGLVKRNGSGGGGATSGRSSGRRTAGQRAIDKPTNLQTVHTLEEYKEVLDENKGRIVVVRFFATWCKACKAIQSPYCRMASLYPQITFLEVPVTNHNSNLHQGLEVPSLPYGHIYYPEAGLVEELKISKKYFANLVKKVRWYDSGECSLDEYVPPVEEE